MFLPIRFKVLFWLFVLTSRFNVCASLPTSKRTNGLATFLSIGMSLPVFYYSDHILSKVTHQKLMVLAQGIFALRLLLHAWLSVAFHHTLEPSASAHDTRGILENPENSNYHSQCIF
jgi:hypothetical protein